MINLTWYGHATLGLETGDKMLLIDPFFSDNPAASTTADKVTADFILITHGHHDHVGDVVEIARRTGATTISNVEISRWLAKQGVKAQEVQLWQNATFPFGEVKLTPAVHGTGLPDGSDGGQPGGFIRTGGRHPGGLSRPRVSKNFARLAGTGRFFGFFLIDGRNPLPGNRASIIAQTPNFSPGGDQRV